MTDWSTIIPDESSPPHDKNFADHQWLDTLHGRICTKCDRKWQDVLGEDSKPCYGSNHSERTRAQMEAEREWLWLTITDAASAGSK